MVRGFPGTYEKDVGGAKAGIEGKSEGFYSEDVPIPLRLQDVTDGL